MGDEADTSFWYDRWIGETPFSVRFRHLFDLSLNKSCSVATMFHLGWEEGVKHGGGEGDCGQEGGFSSGV